MEISQITQELDSYFYSSDVPKTSNRSGTSKLAPFREEILARRSQGKSYRQIRDWLFSSHEVSVHHTTVSDFVKRCIKE